MLSSPNKYFVVWSTNYKQMGELFVVMAARTDAINDGQRLRVTCRLIKMPTRCQFYLECGKRLRAAQTV